MSSGNTQVAILGMRGQMVSEEVAHSTRVGPPAIRLLAFAALALYGATRWSTLLSTGATGRLAGLVALALLVAAGRPFVAKHSRVAAALFTALVLLAVLPVAGVPLRWVVHVRIAVTARAIGEGLSALPQTLVPYVGVNPWVRLDFILGGAVLLFDAALLLAHAPRHMSDLRRAGIGLPLVALVGVPSTLVHPRYPYLAGLLLFLILAAFVLGDRITSRQASAALGLGLLTAVAAMLVAPGLDRHKPWVNYWTLAGGLAPKVVDTFNWSQTYGPVTWPRRGRTVLEVAARRPEYWKTQDLDVFDGRGWTQGVIPGQGGTPAPSPGAVAAWTQTIQVTLRDMRSSYIVGAGVSSPPTHVAQPVVAGFSTGTWTSGTPLQPGDSYSIRTYAPQPGAKQLRRAGADYTGLPIGYRTILLRRGAGSVTDPSAQIVFPSFHSAGVRNVVGQTGGGVIGLGGAAVIRGSVYAPAYALAQRLARGAATPYAFVLAVKRYLAHGFVYSQHPALRSYPLESFLFTDRRGYCQQFAGAMALLLRMGGVPARVAVGFTEGRYDPATGRWLVTDLDAHAWVEVWFPRFGWVRFDPTPAADPALRDSTPLTGITGGLAGTGGNTQTAAGGIARASRAPALRIGSIRRRSGVDVVAIAAPAGGVGLIIIVLLLIVSRPLRSVDARVAELERALRRSGRPLRAGDTLAALEDRMRGRPDARGYVEALRVARYGGGHEPPTRRQRRALRRQLAVGRGPLGRLRSLWALPPRRRQAPKLPR
jgi:transglutaminase-like putative cysteine protease